jgi:hypothetical protein
MSSGVHNKTEMEKSDEKMYPPGLNSSFALNQNWKGNFHGFLCTQHCREREGERFSAFSLSPGISRGKNMYYSQNSVFFNFAGEHSHQAVRGGDMTT